MSCKTYVNDISSLYHACRVKLFANDVKVYKVIKGSIGNILLQNALNAIRVRSRN